MSLPACGRRALVLSALLGALLTVSPARAHKGRHGKPSPPPSGSPSPSASPSLSAVVSSSVPSATEAPPSPLVSALSAGPATPEGSVWRELSWRDVVLTHPHNKIVHFPLALGLAAALFLLGSGRWPSNLPAARALLLAAALVAIAAFFTGRAQEEPFEDGPLAQVVELHETMGTASAITLWIGVILTAWAPARRWLWLYGIVLLLALSGTGVLGGLLSHGEL